jgi:hypothetical protein
MEKVSPEPMSGCWLWTGAVNKNGYASFWDGKHAATASHFAFRVVGGNEFPEGLFVLHRCDNPICVNPNHLYAGTHKQNMVDKKTRKRARGAKGERNHKAKLSVQQVLEIRGSTEGVCELSRRYGINRNQISAIKRGESWTCL